MMLQSAFGPSFEVSIRTLWFDDSSGGLGNIEVLGMTETQVLLGKIAALRQRLEQAQGLAREAGSAAASLVEETRDEKGRIWRLERRLAAGADDSALLDG